MPLDKKEILLSKLRRRPMSQSELSDTGEVSFNDVPALMTELVADGLAEETAAGGWAVKHDD